MKTIHGKNVNDFCGRTGSTGKNKHKQTHGHDHSKTDKFGFQAFKMSAQFGHIIHQTRHERV